MNTVHDDEFGDIAIRRSVRSSSVRISVAPNGSLKASLPPYAPIFMLKRLVNSSRSELRKMLERHQPAYDITHGALIGKSHRIAIVRAKTSAVKRYKQQITVLLAPHADVADPDIAKQIRKEVTNALRLEAKSYLPKRLRYLADQLGYDYDKVRFSHASSRWGSCSSNGTISLNIALMKLPFELIDYVLVHELSHTKQMNHSQKFWSLVERGDPSYKLHRKLLKSHSPTI
jgi:predicted metal-dependent hydrolase